MVSSGLIEKSVADTLVQQLVARPPDATPNLPAKRPLDTSKAPPVSAASGTGADGESFDELMEKAKKNKNDSLLWYT